MTRLALQRGTPDRTAVTSEDAATGSPTLVRSGMAISLSKGSDTSLTAQAPGLRTVTVGFGWDARATPGQGFDLDSSAILGGADARVLSGGHFVFFNNTTSPDGAVVHSGDNLSGAGEGDDEQLLVALDRLPAAAASVVFAVSIYEAAARSQTFGELRNAFIQVLDDADGTELARYDLSEDATDETAMIFGELYRAADAWKFRAVGLGYVDGLQGIARDYAIPL